MNPQDKQTKISTVVSELLSRAAAHYQRASEPPASAAPPAIPAAISEEAKALEAAEQAEQAADVVKYGDQAVSKAIEVLQGLVAPPGLPV